ncbi:MAG: glycosyltransferase [Rhodospirillales bacterium]|nr:glycosyltransferase [Rhodospirillales bacterium]
MNPHKPPYILVFAADQMGCGAHRCVFPLSALVSANVADGRVDVAAWAAEQFKACAPDVIVFQRPVEDAQLQALETARATCPDAFIVYELDDRLDVVPEKSYHAGFIAKNVTERVKRGLTLCDAATTTTENMAAWLRSLGAKDVRVIPNLLPVAKIREREQQPGRKLRVGWAGGLSHGGDLALIVPAMAAIGDAVEWVFFGAKPDGKLPVAIEFHDGVPPHTYLDRLLSLDLDLMLAPLEDNVFNRAKSNLRLAEAGIIGAAVIASEVHPYTDGTPPVFGYASSEAGWLTEIRRFIDTPASERTKAARALQHWVGRHYTFEARLKDRLAAWLPAGAAHFTPGMAKQPLEPVVIASPGGRDTLTLPDSLRYAPVETSLPTAAAKARSLGADLLYLRNSAILTDAGWQRMRTALLQSPDIAAVLPLAPDGPNAFPRLDGFVPTSVETVQAVQAIVQDRLVHRRLGVPVLGGPAMLLSRHALALLGAPDTAEGDEAGLLEWGLRGTPRGWKLVQAADAYAGAIVPPPPATPSFGARIAQRGYAQFIGMAQSEALPATDREGVELSLLREHWNGVRPGLMGFPNDYPTWALLRGQAPATGMVPDGIVTVLPFGVEPDTAVGAEWVVFTDERVALKPHALSVLADACARADANVAVIYADHEVRDGDALLPDFKPDFDADLLFGRDYVTQVAAVRVQCLSDLPRDRLALYQHVLLEGLADPSRVRHVPQVLATLAALTPEEAGLEAAHRAVLLSSLFAEDAVEIEPLRQAVGVIRLRWRWEYHGDAPKVSVIVPTKGDGWMLQPCLGTLLRLTAYPNFEVIVVCNNGEPDLGEWRDDPRITVMPWTDAYNWSAINNAAIAKATGDLICCMNDDVRVIEPSWLDRMVGQALRPSVGTVGAKLVYPTGHIQHVGVVCHKGVCGHRLKGAAPGSTGAWGAALLTRQALAVTGAVMLFRREVYADAGAFDETFDLNYNDVEFCLRVRERGRVNVVEMGAELIHYEGATRASPATAEGLRKLQADNAKLAPLIAGPDPHWHPNFNIVLSGDQLTLQGLDGNVLVWDEAKPSPSAPRVLLVNDRPGFEGRAFLEHESGHVPLFADLSGFVLRLTAPVAPNAPGWDVRQPARIAQALAALGVDRVVLRSLVGQYGAAPPVETLRGLARLGVPVEVDPIDPLLVCPWQGDEPPKDSPFGDVDETAWRAAYAALAGGPTEAAA